MMLENRIYKCEESRFEILEKKIKRITKKLDRLNIEYDFEVIGESIEEVDYILEDGRKKTVNIKAVNYKFDMEQLKIGDYQVVAIIDHNTGIEENLVYPINNFDSLPNKYYKTDCYCEHCKTKRKRNKTAVLLNNDDNSFIQLGLTCIREYTGIDATDVIKWYDEMSSILVDDIEVNWSNHQGVSFYRNTQDYLVSCISSIRKEGYIPQETSMLAFTLSEHDANDIDRTEAQKVIDFFKTLETNDNFLRNIKTALEIKGVKKANGLVAYSYIAYQKELERIEKQKAIEENKGLSKHVGNIKERIDIQDVKIKLLTTVYNNYTGFSETATHIYKLTDNDNNVFIWKTSNYIEEIENNPLCLFNVKGTVKEHNSYKGEQQTVLTRCKYTLI